MAATVGIGSRTAEEGFKLQPVGAEYDSKLGCTMYEMRVTHGETTLVETKHRYSGLRALWESGPKSSSFPVRRVFKNSAAVVRERLKYTHIFLQEALLQPISDLYTNSVLATLGITAVLDAVVMEQALARGFLARKNFSKSKDDRAGAGTGAWFPGTPGVARD